MPEETPCATPTTTTTHTGMASRVASWLQKVLSESDGTPSVKRLVYVAAVAWAMGLTTGALTKYGLTPEVVDLTKTLLYVCGGGYAVGRFAENK
jgi:hypothetical protein